MTATKYGTVTLVIEQWSRQAAAYVPKGERTIRVEVYPKTLKGEGYTFRRTDGRTTAHQYQQSIRYSVKPETLVVD